jgi:predicted nuclease of predicted toxin-antitoxin system
MKFLLDVCASSRALRALLSDLGHDVLSALDRDPRASDEAILALAMQEARVLVTEDKDVGELVFVRRLPYPCIIRFVDMRVEEKVAAMRELLERYADAIDDGALIVVTRGRIRIRLRFEVRDNGGRGGH